jgi:hypothetical protein
MGKLFDSIDDTLKAWMEAQPLWFVATAPLGADGHVNVSPRGHDSFSVLDDHRVGWVDYTGSGVETIAHLRENGRITLMFCAFDGPPRIVRLHGRASVLLPGEPGFDELLARFEPPEHALRSLIRVDVERIADSCGYGVPLMRFDGKRTQYDKWADNKVRNGGFDAYIEEKNAESIDGLPAIG